MSMKGVSRTLGHLPMGHWLPLLPKKRLNLIAQNTCRGSWKECNSISSGGDKSAAEAAACFYPNTSRPRIVSDSEQGLEKNSMREFAMRNRDLFKCFAGIKAGDLRLKRQAFVLRGSGRHEAPAATFKSCFFLTLRWRSRPRNIFMDKN